MYVKYIFEVLSLSAVSHSDMHQVDEIVFYSDSIKGKNIYLSDFIHMSESMQTKNTDLALLLF